MHSKTAEPDNDHTPKKPFYRFRLFVADDEPNSLKAREVIIHLCNAHLKDHYEMHIVDVFKDYQAAIDHGVIMVPTLFIEAPPPPKTIVGSLSDEEKVLRVLGITRKGV